MAASSQVTQADAETAFEGGVRLGLIVYGVVHLLIAYTAVRLAIGDRDEKASQQGAISQLAQSGLGVAGLVAVAVGFAALVVWQAREAAVGHRQDDGATRVVKRVTSAARVVIYGILGLSAAQKALSSGSGGGGGTDSLTRRVMSMTGGQTLVGLVGAGVVAVGLYLVWYGATRRFRKRLDAESRRNDRSQLIDVVGVAGYIAKGVAFAGIGALFVVAAVEFEPKQSGGLDQALRTLLQQPLGPALVIAVGLGFGSYGIFCLAWARHRDESR